MPIPEMLLSLRGLSIGDAFGETFGELRWVHADAAERNARRELAPGPWHWTDDTHMALSVVEVLREHGQIEVDALAAAFARRYARDPHRGYGGGARRLLRAVAEGADWRTEAAGMFNGSGSFGNGAAMRAAPIGAYFAGDPARAAREGARSAEPTHTHRDGTAGAVAVAAAAAIAAGPNPPQGGEFLRAVLAHLTPSRVRSGIEQSLLIPPQYPEQAARMLGSGANVSAQDTVPYCLWICAHHRSDYESALWMTASGLGDVDTTCAIVGGIAALVSPPPAEWLARREPLPEGFEPGSETPNGMIG